MHTNNSVSFGRVSLWFLAGLLIVAVSVIGCSRGLEAPKQAQDQQRTGRPITGGTGDALAPENPSNDSSKLPTANEISYISGEDTTDQPRRSPDERRPAPVQRKIIYNTTIDVVVGDFAKAEQEINNLIKTHNGYVAESETNGSPGDRRGGRWRVRIPTDEYDVFVSALGRIGELQRKKQDSQDVTDEYFDLQSRIKNKQTEEKSIVQLLEKTVGRMDEILTVRRELSRVREEIERMQGRQQLLGNLTAYTTISIACQEHSRFVDPAAASFGMRMERTFGGSWSTLVAFGQTIALLIAAVIPWLPVIALVGIAIWMTIRRQQRLIAAQATGENSRTSDSG
jgi:hypothetical protein